MTTETEYGIRKATPSFPARDLLVVPHKGKSLVVGFPAFGRDNYHSNLREMNERYSHSSEIPEITFRPASTSESISAAAYRFEEIAKPGIFDPRASWLHTGLIFATAEGVFVNLPENLPRDEREREIITTETLKKGLNGASKVNGVYLADNDFGFAPRETFQTGVQDIDTFAEGGLARVLEHTEGRAENLGIIGSPGNYEGGVNVTNFYFDKRNPTLSVLGLGSRTIRGKRVLAVAGNLSYGGGDGYAYGVLDN